MPIPALEPPAMEATGNRWRTCTTRVCSAHCRCRWPPRSSPSLRDQSMKSRVARPRVARVKVKRLGLLDTTRLVAVRNRDRAPSDYRSTHILVLLLPLQLERRSVCAVLDPSGAIEPAISSSAVVKPLEESTRRSPNWLKMIVTHSRPLHVCSLLSDLSEHGLHRSG